MTPPSALWRITIGRTPFNVNMLIPAKPAVRRVPRHARLRREGLWSSGIPGIHGILGHAGFFRALTVFPALLVISEPCALQWPCSHKGYGKPYAEHVAVFLVVYPLLVVVA